MWLLTPEHLPFRCWPVLFDVDSFAENTLKTTPPLQNTPQKPSPCIPTEEQQCFCFTCEATAHFRYIILFLILCMHYASILHIIVRLGSLWSRLLGARLQVLQSIGGSHFPTEGLAWRLRRSIIVT